MTSTNREKRQGNYGTDRTREGEVQANGPDSSTEKQQNDELSLQKY